MKPFLILDWYGRKYASAYDINKAYVSGLIHRSVQSTQYGAWYTYTTLRGESICRFYQDSSFGFSSQAYGVQLPDNLDFSKPLHEDAELLDMHVEYELRKDGFRN